MRNKLFIVISILQIFFLNLHCYCQTKKDFKKVDLIDNNTYYLNETNNEYILSFLKFVIKDQKLDSSYGLSKKPAEFLDMYRDDKRFLSSFLKVTDTIPKNSDGETLSFSWPAKPKCLTNNDVDYMLSQKSKYKNFTWNIGDFDFVDSNENNWYKFSIPVFSVDSNIAIIGIYHGCPGLCGTGEVLMYTKNTKGWQSETVASWIH